MIKQNDSKIKKFFQLFKESDLDEKLKLKLSSYYATMSSLDALINMNKIINFYLKKEETDEGIVLTKVFGLLQALFVSIDSLYELSYGITERKWTINVNYNDRLRQIKFIRNDVVGHPTRRLYNDNIIGYCNLNLQDTTYYNLVYQIYTVENNQEKVTNYNIDLKEIINSFYFESDKILDEIYGRILLLNGKNGIHLPQLAFQIYKDYKKGLRNRANIEIIKEQYLKKYNLKKDTNDRFIWRLNHLLEVFKWDEENNYSVIDFLVEKTIKKVYLMSNECDTCLPELTIKVKEPFAVRKLKKILIENKDDFTNKNYLKDPINPLFMATINKIKDYAQDDKDIKKLLDLFIQNRHNNTRIFILGGAFDYA